MNFGGQWGRHMDAMVQLTLTRRYPGDTRFLFRDA
jgi:hypothetical protein